MAANTGKLAGKTIFISGASRGIGKAIALKVARDGANVILAAKTAQAHPKLPGTIYTAAEEVVQAGGKGFPCIVDIRHEDQVQDAVQKATKEFGGIDIVINNASAISLTGTLETNMKKYDLMNSINARGTYLCSQACLPFLLKSSNPHILNISPPLNMNPIWFKNHVAYTMAKYGMSLCVLGMAEEFRDAGVAVNALWPRTAIWTAAMEMLGGAGSEIKNQCRSVDIMADAAYAILTKDSKSFTGNFCIDDEVLQNVGVKDMEQYACKQGSKLMPDFFLDVGPEDLNEQIVQSKANANGPSVESTFKIMESMMSETLVKTMGASYQFELTGADEGVWYIDLKSGTGSLGKGALEGADCRMILDSQLFTDMFQGKASATSSFLSGKMKIKGDMKAAMKLEQLMNKANKAKL